MSLDLPGFTAAADARPHDVAWPTMTWPVPAGTKLLGELVALEPTAPADVPDLFTGLDDAEVWEHLPGRPGGPGDMAANIARCHATGTWCTWTVRLNRELAGLPVGGVVGTSSYLDVSVVDARVEIGATAFRRDAWGSGVNAETKLLLLGHAFDRLGAGRVQLKTDVRNVRSQQAIAGIGATFEGVLRRYQRRHDGTVRDTVLFSITAEDWPEVRERLAARVAQAVHG